MFAIAEWPGLTVMEAAHTDALAPCLAAHPNGSSTLQDLILPPLLFNRIKVSWRLPRLDSGPSYPGEGVPREACNIILNWSRHRRRSI